MVDEDFGGRDMHGRLEEVCDIAGGSLKKYTDNTRYCEVGGAELHVTQVSGQERALSAVVKSDDTHSQVWHPDSFTFDYVDGRPKLVAENTDNMRDDSFVGVDVDNVDYDSVPKRYR